MTTPREVAPAIAERLSALGIKGILNFANTELAVTRPDIIVENVHLSDPLMKFCYDLKHKKV